MMHDHIDSTTSGKEYWRSINELAETEEFVQYLHNEFPSQLEQVGTEENRRTFLKLMGASLALAGVMLPAGCRRWPDEKIAPFSRRPENYVPGEPVDFATSMELGGSGRGLLVRSYDGRPVKVEGNELHPESLGATDSFAQASILEFYDPERSRSPIERTFKKGEVETAEVRSTEDALAALEGVFRQLRSNRGKGLAILAGASSSPTQGDMRDRLMRTLPDAEWFEYEAVSRDEEISGARLAMGGGGGKSFRAHYNIKDADVIVAFDSDFLNTHPASIRHAREFADRRRDPAKGMNRLYSVEGVLSITGSNADHRLPVRSADVASVAAMMARALEGVGGGGVSVLGADAIAEDGANAAWSEFVEAMATDLADHRGKSLIIAGPRQPAAVHALVHAMNFALGNVGKTINYTAEPDGNRASHVEAIRSLVQRAETGQIDTLLMLGGNPVYDAPGDLNFADAIATVPNRVHLSLYDDETSQKCHWHVNAAHFLESWGDARAYDGTISIIQPLLDKLWGGLTNIEMLAIVTGDGLRDGYDIVQRWFRDRRGGGSDFDNAWRQYLHDGVLADSGWAFENESASMQAGRWGDDLNALLSRNSDPGTEVNFTVDPTVYDGRFANNGWLQELPDPIAKICWDNAAFMSPATAEANGLSQNEMVYVEFPDSADDQGPLRLPVHIVPWHADDSITVNLGYGRKHAGRVGSDVGFDVYPYRRTGNMHMVSGVTIGKASGSYELATVQDHHAMDTEITRKGTQARLPVLLRDARLDRFQDEGKYSFFPVGQYPHHPPVVSLWEEQKFDQSRHRWAMAIDLNACNGCSTCMIACQAENNIPIVGKDQVIRGREMHWLRVDRYFSFKPTKFNSSGKPVAWSRNDVSKAAFQPITCQHCENAPCEQVCPVAATVHDREGLNVMVYNRCVGTRYCSNNCPYKVRRFNFYDWHAENPREPGLKPPALMIPDEQTNAAFDGDNEVARMKFNPEVTVRMRGVMEKCSFCVQRINQAKIKSKNDWVQHKRTDEPVIPDGTLKTACAQACPANAIIFGDLNDPDSQVSQHFNKKKSPRAYALLEELNAQPRTRFLGKVRNVNATLSPRPEAPVNVKAHGDDHSDHDDHGHDDHDHHNHGGEDH